MAKSGPVALDKLPKREAELFRVLCDHYEKRSWKKCFHTAGEIFSVFPEQPDTLAMLGLTKINAPKDEGGDKPDGIEMIKKALRLSNFASYICWHVYGLYYRGEHMYADAAKCYKNALRHSPENLQILRDLATLQVQTRDLAGHVETRRKLLQLKPAMLLSWYQLAAAEHLAGHADTALRVVTEAVAKKREDFAEQQKTQQPPRNARELQARQNAWLEQRHELGGLLLYQALLHELTGGPQAALDDLAAHAGDLPDKLGVRERRAELLLRLGDRAKAEQAYRDLLRINPDHAAYHAGLAAALGIADQPRKLAEHYDALIGAAALKKGTVALLHVLRLQALAAAGEDMAATFSARLKELLRDGIRRGVPSTFQAVKSAIYRTPETAAATGAVAEELLAEAEQADAATAPPTVLLWTLHFAAQHYSHMGEVEKALALIGRAKEHTPTCIDVHTAHARILRHAGNLVGAADAYEQARKLDTADRYLNTRAVRYLLRANRPVEALKNVALFLRDGATSTGPQAMLADMQVSWFEYEAGSCYLRMGDHGHALKMFLSIEKHYNDFLEDQFDFHYFCFRKCSVSEYIRLIRLEDGLLANRVFVRAALSAIRTYFALDDMRKAGVAPKPVDEITAATAIPPETEETKKKKPASHKDAEKDADPNGEQLAAVENPLKEAERLALRLLGARPEMPAAVHSAAAEVYLRQDKLALAVKHAAVAKKVATPEELPDALRIAVLVSHRVAATAAAADINKDDLAFIAGDPEVLLREQSAASMACTAALAEAICAITPEKLPQCFAALTAAPAPKTLADAERAHLFVQNAAALPAEQKEVFRQSLRKHFPHATCLKTKQELADDASASTTASKPEHP